MNRHRRLLLAAGLLALGAPAGGSAQQKVWRIAYVAGAARPASWEAGSYVGFTHGMRELGYVEGRDYQMEWHFADGKYERFPDIAAELVKARVDLIILGAPVAVPVLARATRTIPIVVAYWTDPLNGGYARSLSRPGGNITGLSGMSVEIGPKHLDLLRSVKPGLRRVAVLSHTGRKDHEAITQGIRQAAQKLGISVLPIEARVPEEIDIAFSAMASERSQAVIVHADAFFLTHRQKIADLAIQNGLASIFAMQDYAAAGGLLSYGQAAREFNRRAASYAQRIMNGASPGDLPIAQPTLFELSVNRKTAARLGISLPADLLLSAIKVYD